MDVAKPGAMMVAAMPSRHASHCIIEQSVNSGDLVKAVSVKATRCRLRVGLECACAAAPLDLWTPVESLNVAICSTTLLGGHEVSACTAMEESGTALRYGPLVQSRCYVRCSPSMIDGDASKLWWR
jgi:hypothetical protein